MVKSSRVPAHPWWLSGGCFPSANAEGFVLLLLLLEAAPGLPGSTARHRRRRDGVSGQTRQPPAAKQSNGLAGASGDGGTRPQLTS